MNIAGSSNGLLNNVKTHLFDFFFRMTKKKKEPTNKMTPWESNILPPILFSSTSIELLSAHYMQLARTHNGTYSE